MRLTADLAAKRNVVLPAATHDRYVANSQGTTPLTVTAPADESSVTASPVTVTGTTTAGNTVYVAATNTDADSATTIASTVAAPDGSFSIDVEVTGGTSVINIVAVSPSGGTAQEQRTILFDFVPGTLILDVADPDGDDNGPGNYAYPKSANFHAGAFDIQRFQVYDADTEVIFRLQTRNLSETFGSPLGAQLVDVYVHVPGAATTSTAAANASRNFQIAQPDAWSRLIQVQGFGQRYVDASGTTTLGTVSISANPISRFITFRVSKDSLGQPVSGWSFIVVLTGQDGFSPDNARGFQSTPGDFAVRRLRGGQRRCALHREPGHGSQAHGRDHAGRRRPVGRGRLHDPHAGRAVRRGHPLIEVLRGGSAMLKTVARTTDVEPGHVRAFEVRDDGAEAVGRSRIPLLKAMGVGRSKETRITLANVAGTLFAIDDTCTHRGCSLGDGKLDGSTVQCACHGSRFDVTSGAVVRGPAEDPVRSYPVHVANGEVQVDL